MDAAATALEQGIGQAANVLEDMAKLRPTITPAIARLLGMTNVPQTRRMACAIIANAMVFHQRIAGMHDGLKPLRLVCGPGVANPQDETLSAWAEILKINYWPIFAIAKDILEQLPGDTAASMLAGLRENGATNRRNRRRQRPRPDRAHLPAADCRPQVPGHLLHSAGVGGAAGPAGRGQAGRRGLERRRRHRPAPRRRFRLRHRRPAVGGVRADRRPP